MHRIIPITTILILLSLACSTLAPTQEPLPTRTEAVESPTAQPVSTMPATEAVATDAPATADPTPAAETPGDTPAPEAGNVELDPAIAAQMDQIQQDVINLRGLEPDGSFSRALLTSEELRQKVLDDFFSDYSAEEAAEDVTVLSTLGLLEPDFDLMSFYVDLYAEQVAGYYDHETREMYVVLGEGFEGTERMTYAHEYTHALQDQTYDIDDGLNYNEDSCKDDSERCAGIQALMEGDATLSEYLWYYSYGTAQDQQDVEAFYDSYESPVYDSAPPFMQEDFLFAYTYGLSFTMGLWQEGGWPAVDAAYVDLPDSTEQIMHPELYPDEMPFAITIPVDLTGTLGTDWRQIDSGTMGEWYTFLILGRGISPDFQIDDSTAFAAAAGWGGDAYQIFYNDATGQAVLVMVTTWEDENERSEFVQAFQQYGDRRFGVPAVPEGDDLLWEYAAGFNGLYLDIGVSTIWILGPDRATVELVADALAVR